LTASLNIVDLARVLVLDWTSN